MILAIWDRWEYGKRLDDGANERYLKDGAVDINRNGYEMLHVTISTEQSD